MMKLFLFLILVVLGCNCPEFSSEELHGKWILSEHNPPMTKYNDKGYLELNSDYTFYSNFSYFFLLDSLKGDSSLYGTWNATASCYNFTLDEFTITLTTKDTSREWSYYATDTTLSLSAWSEASSWYREE